MNRQDAAAGAVLDGFKMGIDAAAKIIETCTDEQLNTTMAGATPQEMWQAAALLVRQQGAVAVASLAARRPSAQN